MPNENLIMCISKNSLIFPLFEGLELLVCPLKVDAFFFKIKIIFFASIFAASFGT